MKKLTKLNTAFVLLAVIGLGFVTSASARLQSQVSQGHGIKCYQQLVSDVNGVRKYQQVCRKVGV